MQKISCQTLVLLLYFLKRRTYYIFRIIRVAEQFNSRINIVFQISETNYFTKTFLLVQYSIGSAERLQQTMIFHVLVHIERIQLFTVKACKEHTHNKTKIKRFHIRLLLFHAQIDVIIVSTEVLCGKKCAEIFIIIVHDGLQFIRFTHTLFCILPCTHTGLFIILTIIGCVCKYCTYTDFRIQRFENLVIAYKHRNRLHGEQCVKLSIKCRFIEVVKDKSCNLLHTSLVIVINYFVAVIILHKEAKHVFIRYCIFNKIFMETVSKYFLRGMSINSILGENRCSSKTEYLGIVKELHYLLMTIPKMTAMALIKYHHDT